MVVTTEFDGLLALQMFIAVLLPAVVGLLTTRLTPGPGKSALLLGLTTVSSVASELAKDLQEHTEFRVVDVLLLAACSYVLSMAVHLGVMVPFGLKDKLADVGVKADPRLAALAVATAPVLTEQGPVEQAQLGASIDYAEGAPVQGLTVTAPHDPAVMVNVPQLVPHPLDPQADLVTPQESQQILASQLAPAFVPPVASRQDSFLAGLPQADAPKHRAGE